MLDFLIHTLYKQGVNITFTFSEISMNSYLMKTLALGLFLIACTFSNAASFEQGKPKIQSIDVISFQPEGILLIGDGKLGRLY